MLVDKALARPTAKIAAAFVAAHRIGPDELPSLITSIAASLGSAASGSSDGRLGASGVVSSKATPAQVRKSILPHALISFEDGKSYRALKRHLGAFGLTPDAYRVKWGLPSDYPMVCPDYRAVRSTLALEIGLGRKGRPKTPAAPTAGASRPAPVKGSAAKPARAPAKANGAGKPPAARKAGTKGGGRTKGDGVKAGKSKSTRANKKTR